MTAPLSGPNQFQGGVFSKQLPKGRASAEITLDFSSVTAVTSGGERFELRYDEISLEMGGASGRMVFCRNTDRTVTIFCEEKHFPAALENLSSGILRTELERVVGNRKRERRRGRLLTWSLVAVLLLAIGGAYFGVKQGARAAVRSLPFSVDEQIGKLALGSADSGFPGLQDEQVQAAMERIVERLEPHSAIAEVNFEVRVVDGPIINAYALPGGSITVFTGLIEGAESAEEVAGVLAHEMAHVTKRHGLERIAGQLGIVVGVQLIFGDVSGLLALGVELGQYAAQNSYSRSQETEADLEGARMLHAAGIDPLASTLFFERIAPEGEGAMPAWMSTHPDTRARIERLRKFAATLPEKEFQSLGIDWEKIRSRVKGSLPVQEGGDLPGND